jgi:ATP-dependent Lon protease
MVPLRDRVVFPAMMVPLAVGRPSSVRAFEHAMARGNRVFLAAQLAAARDNPTPGELYQLGTLCRIAMSVKTPHGGLRVVVEGVERGRILELTGEQSFFEAVAGILPRTVTTGPGIDALVSRASRLFERYVRLLDPSRPDAPFSADDLRDPDKLANTICAYMAVSIEEKQALLSFLSPAEQLDRVISTLGAEIGRFTRAKKLGKLFSRRRSE